MFEHEPDSDDDFEGYFLKPVNEYNIVDKIKEANKELFSTPQPSSPLPTALQRKVKFKAVLEEYDEPTEGDGNDSEATITKEDTTEQQTNTVIPQDIPKITETIVEEVEVMPESESEVEEICEEVEGLDIEQSEHGDLINGEQNIPLTNNDTTELCANNDILSSIEECQQSLTRHSSEELSTSSRTSEDDLSVIVASYLPDDTKKEFEESPKTNNKARPQSGKKYTIKARKNSVKQNVGDILKLRFNYKTCCEYRNSTTEKLPKYTGYLSTYGLSKEQWDKREKRMDKRRKFYIEKNLKATEEQAKKMDDNERAFISWLKNKMRFPINKTKNMFDFRPRRQKTKSK